MAFRKIEYQGYDEVNKRYPYLIIDTDFTVTEYCQRLTIMDSRKDYSYVRRIAALVMAYGSRELPVAKAILAYYATGDSFARTRDLRDIQSDVKEAHECYPELGIAKYGKCIEYQIALLKYSGKRKSHV